MMSVEYLVANARMTMPPAAKLGKTLELAYLTRRDATEKPYFSGSITVMP